MAGQWDSPVTARPAPDPLLGKAAGQGGPSGFDEQKSKTGSRSQLPEQQLGDALMGLVQALVVGFATAPTMGNFLR